MNRFHFGLCACVCVLLWISSTLAQQPPGSRNDVIVPHLIRFSGVLRDLLRHPSTGIAGITFSLYREQEGGTALWVESQNVLPDTNGHYDVLLGAEHSAGVPMELFSSGEARWLGIQVQAQTSEQLRVLLVSVRGQRTLQRASRQDSSP